MSELRVFQETVIGNQKFAILLDEQSKTAYEAVWDEDKKYWNRDFSYAVLGIDTIDVATSLDFDELRKMGYMFE